MFKKYSITGLGNYTKMVSFSLIVLEATGLLPTTEIDHEDLVYALAIGFYFAGELWSQVGTFLRRDLKYGIKRVTPEE